MVKDESRREADVLYQASRALLAADNVEDVLQTLLRTTAGMAAPGTGLGADFALVLEFSPVEGQDLTVVAVWDVRGTWRMPTGTRIPAAMLAPFVEARPLQTVAVSNVAEDERLVPDFAHMLDLFAVRSFVAVPMGAPHAPYGALIAGRRDLAACDETLIRQYEVVAAQAAVAIVNIRLAEKARRRAGQLETGAEISGAAIAVLSMDDLLPLAAELIRERFDLYYVGIFLPDEDGSHMVLHAGTGPAGRQMLSAGYRLDVGEGSMIGWCMATGRARIALDVGADAIRFDNPLLPDTRSEMALPLNSRGRVLGAMTIQSREPAAFDREDIAVLQIMADQLGSAIENARLFEERERRITELSVVNQIGQVLSSHLGLTGLFEAVHQQVSRMFDAQNFYIATHESDSELWTLAFDVERGERQPSRRHSVALGLTGHIIRSRAPLLLSSVADYLAFHQAQGIDPLGDVAHSWLGVPLLVADKVVGVMAIQDYAAEGAYDARDVALFSTIAGQVAGALDNVRLMTEAQARADQLAVVNEVGQALASVLDLDAVLYQIVDSIKDRFGHFFVGILLLEGDELVFRSGSLLGGSGMRHERGGMRLALDGYGLTVAAANSGESVLVNDVKQDSRYGTVEGLEPVKAELDTPIKVKGRTIGVLTVQSDRLNAFDQVDVALLRLLAGQAGIAIENARLFAETEEALGETETLYNVSRLLSAAGDLQEIVASFAEGMYLPGINRAILWNIDRDARDRARALVSVANWHSGEGTPPLPVGARFSLSALPSIRHLLTSSPVFVQDVRTDDRLDDAARAMFEQQNALSLAIVPLWVGRRQTAVLMFVAEQPHRFIAKEIRPYRSLAGQLAIAVENRRLFEQTQRQLAEQAADAREKSELAEQLRARAAELALLNEMGAVLTAAQDVEAVVEAVYRYTTHLMDTTSFYLARYDPETDEVSFPLLIDDNERRRVPSRRGGNGLTEYVVRGGETLLIEDNLEARVQELGIVPTGTMPLCWLGVPLRAGERVVGVLTVQSYSATHHYEARDRELLTAIANQAAIALENARLFEETQLALAETDTLYRTSGGLNAAQTYDEVLQVLRLHTILGDADRSVSLNLFDRPWTAEETPLWIESIVSWQEGKSVNLSIRYALADFPSTRTLLRPDAPTIVSDIAADPRLDEAMRDLYLHRFGARSTIAVPLVAGGLWLGYVNGLYQEPAEFPEAQMRLLMALVAQAGVAVQNLRQLHETRARAQREQTLREITTRVRSSTDPEVVARTAVRELGSALGRPAFVRLASPEELAAVDPTLVPASQGQASDTTGRTAGTRQEGGE